QPVATWGGIVSVPHVQAYRDRVDERASGRDVDVAGGGRAGAEGRARGRAAGRGRGRGRRAAGRGGVRGRRHHRDVGAGSPGEAGRGRAAGDDRAAGGAAGATV